MEDDGDRTNGNKEMEFDTDGDGIGYGDKDYEYWHFLKEAIILLTTAFGKYLLFILPFVLDRVGRFTCPGDRVSLLLIRI